MITPQFKLDQNDEYLFLIIRAPYANLNEVDLFVENNDLRFFCKPYYLRLNLPGNILENNQNSTYDFDEKSFKFEFKKENKGQVFEGLDLLTKLLTPNKTNKHTGPLVEEISNENADNLFDKNDVDHVDDDDIDNEGNEWYLEQSINQDTQLEINIKASNFKYGFAQTKSDIFNKLSTEYCLIIDNPDPENISIEKRAELRILDENEKFDEDHYLADYFDSDIIEDTILNYVPTYITETNFEYTEKEIDCLKSLPKKTFLLDKQQKFYACCGLVDILFAYCYNNRINCGEQNVESGWTVAKLSSTLSWFDVFNSLEDCLIASVRRSLCFPLYRNWQLSQAVLKDLINLLKKDIKLIIKVLIEIRGYFLDTDCRYILNDLYINDYIVWIQYFNKKKLHSLIEYLEKINISKEMMNLDLECIEMAGKLALEDENKDSDCDSKSDDLKLATKIEPEIKNTTIQIAALNLD